MTEQATKAYQAMQSKLAQQPLLSDSGLHLQYADLVIEADADGVDIGQGALLLRRDQQSHDRASALLALVEAFLREAGPREQLPQHAPEPPQQAPQIVSDPFGRS